MEAKKSFLGTGWAFPPEFTKNPCQVVMVSDKEDIDQSLRILLSTRHGERIMQPEYGCDLSDLLFTPISTSNISFVKDKIEKAVLYHEPRIDLKGVEINTDRQLEGVVVIVLSGKIRSTNSRYNMVYDFYLKEAERQPK